MELRTINTFLHIAELHSFSRAARELGYSQSAVSAQVAQLEAELETPLFDRVGKTVRLTDAGQTFLTYARSLLATAEQAKAALQPARQVNGTLRVALADSVCSTFLPDLLQRYHALCPQVELVLRTATDDEMLQMLGSNQIDLAYTLDKPLRCGVLSQCIPQNFSRLPHQRHHPREGGCADQEEKDAVRQRRVGLIPAVEHGEHQQHIHKRDSQPEPDRQTQQ